MPSLQQIDDLKREALDEILRREGSTYTNHPSDRGGPTKFGVTLRTYQDWIGDPTAGPETIRNLTEETARAVFSGVYFDGHGFERIESLTVYKHLLDMSVHHGVPNTSCMLQKACGATVDGIIGPRTAARANTMLWDELATALVYRRMIFIAKIVQEDPTQAVFLVGWTKRVLSFLPFNPYRD